MTTKTRKQNDTKRIDTRSSRLTANKQDSCFIIMPFGEWFDHYYEKIYIPAIRAVGLIPRRADDLYRPSAIVNDIWSLTKTAKVILADLSGKNPNVFYELGLAHAIAKPAILVASSIDDIPFDLRALRVIIYSKNEPDWGDVLREKIETAINEVLASPLDSVLPTFLKVKESTPPTTVTQAEKELISLKQDMDLIKRELQRKANLLPNLSNDPITRAEAIRLVQDYRESGINDENTLYELEQGGWSTQAARALINKIDNDYLKERSRSKHHSNPKKKNSD
jgi:hypothetical protein